MRFLRARRDRTGPARVLIIVQNLPVPSDRRVWLECQALVSAGHEVTVICPKGDGDPAYEVLDGVRIYKYRPAPATEGVTSFVFEFAYCWLRTSWLALRAYVRHGFDVMQACNPPDTYFALAALFKVFGVRFVYDQHDLCPETYQSRFAEPSPLLSRALGSLERLTYRTADHVISTNESYRAVAMARGGVEPDRVTVVRTGPDDEVMRAGDADYALRHGREHLAVYLGVMGPQDGVDVALTAIASYVRDLGRRDCHFALLGGGDEWANLRRKVTELELDDYVTMPGRVSDEVVFAHFSTADVGLSPDPHSPLNDVSTMNKTMEYLSFGMPVIAFDLPETMVSAGRAAVYVTSDEPIAFAAELADLLDDPTRRRMMGLHGRERVETELAWRHQAADYLTVYSRFSSAPAESAPGVSTVRVGARGSSDVIVRSPR
jgi:glycosyltransferase involved in cell wall biosynthesis